MDKLLINPNSGNVDERDGHDEYDRFVDVRGGCFYPDYGRDKMAMNHAYRCMIGQFHYDPAWGFRVVRRKIIKENIMVKSAKSTNTKTKSPSAKPTTKPPGQLAQEKFIRNFARPHLNIDNDVVTLSGLDNYKLEQIIREHADVIEGIYRSPDSHDAYMIFGDILLDHGLYAQSDLMKMHHTSRFLAESKRKKTLGGKIRTLMKGANSGGVPTLPVTIQSHNSIGMTFASIPPGFITMGNPKQKDMDAGDFPHNCGLTEETLQMSIHQVTQAQWQAVMGDNPSSFSATGESAHLILIADKNKDSVSDEGGVVGTDGNHLRTDNFPVENINWHRADEFCKKLTEMEKDNHPDYYWEYSLPTETIWETAATGGIDKTPFFWGNSLSSFDANFDGRYPYGKAPKGPNLGRPCNVGSYLPNTYGLYDMTGNVWEWTADWYDLQYFSTPKDPTPEEAAALDKALWFALWNDQKKAVKLASSLQLECINTL